MGKQFDEGVALMEKATEQDSTFGMAWLNLQGLYVMTNQGNKRLETVKKAMEYIYKIPERFQWIVKLVLFDANQEHDKTASLIKMQLDLTKEIGKEKIEYIKSEEMNQDLIDVIENKIKGKISPLNAPKVKKDRYDDVDHFIDEILDGLSEEYPDVELSLEI